MGNSLCVCVCVCVCACVCVRVCVCVCLCVCARAHVHVYVCVHIQASARICLSKWMSGVHELVTVFECVCMCMCVCVCVCIRMSVSMKNFPGTRTSVCAHKDVCVRVCAFTFSLIHISTLSTCSLNSRMSLASSSPLPRLLDACSSSFHLDIRLLTRWRISPLAGWLFLISNSPSWKQRETAGIKDVLESHRCFQYLIVMD